MTYRKKLIEVALPLEAINLGSIRERSVRHGHPNTLHTWWSRKPLAACRAVIFASLVDDPSEYCSSEKEILEERERLFSLIEDLVDWEMLDNEDVFDRARLEIARSVSRTLSVPVPVGRDAIREFLATQAPPVLDPFAGGGSIPLEAQRLGLPAYASDLNPVAVLINKALIEVPPKVANMPPVHPPEKRGKPRGQQGLWSMGWTGIRGLAEDVRYYGEWMRDEGIKRIGYLYPPTIITSEMITEQPDLKSSGLKSGDTLPTIAWIWARGVKCPNPACGATMPLVSKWLLSSQKAKKVWLTPIADPRSGSMRFRIEVGEPTHSHLQQINTGTSFLSDKGRKVQATFKCLTCGTGIAKGDYISNEADHGRMVHIPLAIVAESKKGRVYCSFPDDAARDILHKARGILESDDYISEKPTELTRGTFGSNAQGRTYGFKEFGDYFTSRQLATLITFVSLFREAKKNIVEQAKSQLGANLAKEYSDSVLLYLSLVFDKQVDLSNSLNRWEPVAQCPRNLFGRQAISMIWEFAEGNPFGNSSGSWTVLLKNLLKTLDSPLVSHLRSSRGMAWMQDSADSFILNARPAISTDPPYYYNVSYADLSDFFYVWLRRILDNSYPELFNTLLAPKAKELIADPYRFEGDRQKAKSFFEAGLRKSFKNILALSSPDYPTTVFYAFKQAEEEDDKADSDDNGNSGIANRVSTGWESMLEGLLSSGTQITGTWPIRTEMNSRMVGQGANALASSIVLVCRPRPENTGRITRRDFIAVLKKELPLALHELQQGFIAPVDLAQAAIGPGMAVFSRYSAVLEATGKSMSVRTALGLINQALDEYLTEQEGEYDGDTRWALAWFEQFGHNEAAYGVAETLSKAKNTSVEGLVQAGILEARAGKARLLRRDELDTDWDPKTDKRLTSWEAVQHLIYALDVSGEQAAADLLARLGSVAETARDLAYRLYTVCDRKSWSQDALGYNMLVVAWPRLKELANRADSQPKLPL